MTGPSPMLAAPMAPSLADVLERLLDKGMVIAGDIRINLLDIELLTIKLRLLVASVDKAKEMGIDWWERDPSLSSRAVNTPPQSAVDPPGRVVGVARTLEQREVTLTDIWKQR